MNNETRILLRDERLDGRIVILTLNRPATLNAIDEAMALALESEAARLRNDSRVEAIVLTGNGRAFCSGGDLGSFKTALGTGGDGAGELPALLDRLATRVHAAVEALVNSGPLLVAAVNGSATGGGLGLACACDFIYGQPGSSLRPGFARLGLSPDTGTTHSLLRILGYRKALQFLIAGQPLGGAAALELGLFTELIDADGDAFVDQVVERVQALIACGRAARETRRLLRSSATASLHEQLELEKQSLIAMSRDDAVAARLKQALGV